jgi:hypothetical protein
MHSPYSCGAVSTLDFPISYERLAFMMRFFAPVLMIAVG